MFFDGRGQSTMEWVRATWDEVEDTLVRTCWRENWNKSTYKSSPRGEIEEELGGEELNIGSGREGEPVGETAREPVEETTGEMKGACESGESKPVPKE